MKCRRLSLAVVGLAFFVSRTAAAQWSTLTIEMSQTGSPYRCWTKFDGTTTDNVIYLSNPLSTPPNDLCSQIFYNPQGQPVASNNDDEFVMGAGWTGTSTPGFLYGDAIGMVYRRADGRINANPAPAPVTGTSVVMNWPRIDRTVDCSACPAVARLHCNPSQGAYECNWSWVGGLGAGGSFTHTPIKTAGTGGGYEYFALVEVSNYGQTHVGHPYDFNGANPDRFDYCPGPICGCAKNSSTNPESGWYTWAVSKDETGQGGPQAGLKWSFVTPAGGLTTDPAASMKLLARANGHNARYITTDDDPPGQPCRSNDMTIPPAARTGGGWGDSFGKPTLFYNKYDDYFYMNFQWQWGNTYETKRISAAWFRMRFDPYHPFGLGVVERLTNQGGQPVFAAAPCSAGVPGCSILPADGTWESAATYPSDAAIPSDLAILFDEVSAPFTPTYGPRNFDSMLFTYAGAGGTVWRKGTQRTFPFFPTGSPQSLNYPDLITGIQNGTCYVQKLITFNGDFRTGVEQLFPPHVVQGDWDPAGAPGAPSLIGYIAGRRTDLAPCASGLVPSGLIPVHLLVGPRPSTFPIVQGVTPDAGVAGGNTLITLKGATFTPGATIKIGDPATGYSMASSVTVVDSYTITALTPSRTAGSIGDIVVTNQNMQTGTLFDSYLSAFTDVQPGTQYYATVVKIARHHITAGCGTGTTYCPSANISRGQMAVFLVKSKYASFAYAPPPATGNVFTDVPLGNQYGPWIEELFREGITAGCGPGTFCPDANVTRKEMAVFVLKAKNGAGWAPPACHGDWVDVPCPATPLFPYSDWIEAAADQGIIPGGTAGGCSMANRFCPDTNVMRGPMANELVAAFSF